MCIRKQKYEAIVNIHFKIKLQLFKSWLDPEDLEEKF